MQSQATSDNKYKMPFEIAFISKLTYTNLAAYTG